MRRAGSHRPRRALHHGHLCARSAALRAAARQPVLGLDHVCGGEETPFEDDFPPPVGHGYTPSDAADTPGLFHVHGDTVDIYPAQATAPVRIEFFGDEIDRIRRMVSSTGQTIGDEDAVEIYPVRELALTDEAIKRISAALYVPAQNDTELAAMLEMVQQRIVTPELDRFNALAI